VQCHSNYFIFTTPNNHLTISNQLNFKGLFVLGGAPIEGEFMPLDSVPFCMFFKKGENDLKMANQSE
jgi:hypothetical protein